MTPQEFARLKRLGSRAADLLLDNDFKEMIGVLKDRIVRDWKDTLPADRKRRELLYHEVIAIGRIEHYLKELGQDARLEQSKIDAKALKDERHGG